MEYWRFAPLQDSTSPHPSLQRRGKEFVRTCRRSVAFGLALPGKGGEEENPYGGGRGICTWPCLATEGEWEMSRGGMPSAQ